MSTTDVALQEIALEELDFHTVLEHVGRYCVTFMGRDTVLELRPLSMLEHPDVSVLEQELQCVQESVNLIAMGEHIPYDRVSDIRPLIKKSKIEGNYISAPELLSVYDALLTSRSLKRFVSERSERCKHLQLITSALVDDRVLEKHITDAIDDSGAVRDNASRELQTIRREISELSYRLRSRLEKILKKFGEEDLLQDEFITQRDGRFVLPMQVSNKRAVPGIIHGVSASGSTVFMEPAETYEMNNELSILHNREQRELVRILTTLTAEIGAVAENIQAAFDTMLHLDTVFARAHYALAHGGICPTITPEETIELTGVRHPILVQQKGVEVIPLSVEFSPTTRGILISGPNAGGKTVAMKTIGLSLCMAMSGIFPLGMCSMNVRRVFTAIGDHQSIDSNLSTFSSQIIRLRDVLSYAGNDMLVLIDEICAGTDPAEGGALAAGILDSLIERTASFVVTTHQSSLKQYALTRPSITNASLAFDSEKLVPTFHFLYGVPGNSYAFVLATNVGLPEVVVERGKTYLGERHNELEESINAMQRFKAEAHNATTAAAQELAKAESLRKDYENRLAQVKEKRATVVNDAREEAREMLRKAQGLIENTIREVRESQKSAATIKQEFELGKQELVTEAPSPKAVVADPAAVAVDMVVTLNGGTTRGTVLSIDDKGATARVDVNGITFQFPLSALDPVLGVGGRPQQAQKAQPVKPSKGDGVILKMDARTSCDVRGMRADEALRAIETFLSDAIMGNVPFVSIIHGKGTGALRRVVQEYLADHHQVATFRLGELGEGGDGITIAELR